MSVATSTAIAIAGAAAAGASIYGAHESASAAKTAAQQQTQSSNQALQLQQGIYNQTHGDLAPYNQTGQAALGTLRGLVGLPSLPAQASPTAVNALGSLGQGVIPAGSMVSRVPGGIGAPTPVDLPLTGQTAIPRVGSSYGGGTVTMRAPDGSTAPVPQDAVAHYSALGATVVS